MRNGPLYVHDLPFWVSEDLMRTSTIFENLTNVFFTNGLAKSMQNIQIQT